MNKVQFSNNELPEFDTGHEIVEELIKMKKTISLEDGDVIVITQKFLQS